MGTHRALCICSTLSCVSFIFCWFCFPLETLVGLLEEIVTVAWCRLQLWILLLKERSCRNFAVLTCDIGHPILCMTLTEPCVLVWIKTQGTDVHAALGAAAQLSPSRFCGQNFNYRAPTYGYCVCISWSYFILCVKYYIQSFKGSVVSSKREKTDSL